MQQCPPLQAMRLRQRDLASNLATAQDASRVSVEHRSVSENDVTSAHGVADRNATSCLLASSTGLSDDEARERLRRDGPNRLPPPRRTTLGAALMSVALQPMVLLLLACASLYAALGSGADAVVLGLSIVAVAAISTYQELRTQHVLEALRELASPRSSVVRGGVLRRIPSQELVVGDRLVVQEGDRMACDAEVVEAHGLRVDESMLTGESVPVDKGPGLADPGSSVLQGGTLVVQGDGVANVVATGARSALGRIGGEIASIKTRPSRLHDELTRIVRVVALAAMLTCLFAATVFAWREGSWTAGLLVGLTLAMSIVPEEFAVVWTVMLALGAWRLASRQVLTRQPQAIEALGSTTVLCVDKTGTLTCNQMAIAALHDGGRTHECGDEAVVRESLSPLLRIAALASVREGLEPMDAAILRLAGQVAPPGELRWREGVSPGRPFVSNDWAAGTGGLLAIKGAPEVVLSRCVDPPERLRALGAQADAWAAAGRRVLAVAAAEHGGEPAPRDGGWRALGLIAFHDPLRDDVYASIDECRRAGVRVIMMTGDAPATALAIARQAGLLRDNDATVLGGAELEGMSEARLELAIASVVVFARVTPAQKLRIVQALQRRGEVVAMTGDGVNDGPALRAADVGVAMGRRGTDVAREAAALVLLDDRFASLVDAVRAGRRVFVNLRKAMSYLFAVHVPIVGLSLLPLLGGPILLLPIHVVLLELIIDPACSLVFEAEPAPDDVMRVPPRRADAALFDGAAIMRALGVGATALAAVVVVQFVCRAASVSQEALRLAGLATVVVANLAMLRWYLGRRGKGHATNHAFDGLLVGTAALGGFVLLLAPARRAFGFPVQLGGAEMAAWLAFLVIPAMWAARRLLHASPPLSPRGA